MARATTAPYPPIPPLDTTMEDGLVDARSIAKKDKLIGAGYTFHYKPNYRWVYYANMVKDEILSFKLVDTNLSLAGSTQYLFR
ncbi:uncharacterized protein Z519_04619 [Cladophialophora bantiana CBS 173.52]|uniref:Uncharacterized protein n=1 Tax=Cladophialophora bantiana (strain ATCC 10958 / CBS 173.52 / CDC B-1940 / NIH 8579) TaxID=1442370 RepID=A0A0D2HMP9_CLAB1|nr:uncharacterized protein Z519_04619 [Cladophialophora bantiana CBS 173.52]KIW94643.1 hypothetical protein Z519_04619 [Cladophialophora bantiana CBS 173.52]